MCMHVASHSEAGRAILNEPNTRDRLNSQNVVIIDNPEKGLNVLNTGIVL